MWNDDNGQWHMMGGSGAALGMMLVFLLIVIAGAVALVLVIRDPTRTSARILRERLARGEIDEPEYENRLRLIERHGPTS